MRKACALMVIILLVLVGFSCRHEPQLPPEVYNPTAYTLVYPDFVTSKIGVPIIPIDNPTTMQGVSLGRKLFYDNKLSGDKTISCASCHGQANSFDDTNRFSKGITGQFGGRNAMAIVNLAWSDRFFWDGRRNSLEGQAHDPVANPIEMNSKWPDVVKKLQQDRYYPELFFQAFGTKTIDSNLVTKAIAQFERTLISYNSFFDKVVYLHTATFDSHQGNGYELFQIFHCTNCHTFGQFTDHAFRNNGLDLSPADSGLAQFTHNPADYGKFKVPSLRNIALTAPYMHDGRLTTLEAVVGFYSKAVQHGSPNIDTNMQFFTVANAMTRDQQDDIVTFLKTLTDSSYIVNPVYSNQ